MANREFHVVSEPYGNSFRGVVRLTCGACGAQDSIFAGGKGQGFGTHPDFVRSKFTQMGWDVDKAKTGARDRCPKCVSRRMENIGIEKAQRKIAEVPAGSQEQQPPMNKNVIPMDPSRPKAEPPRELTREHARRIRSKIDEVYLSNSYADGWSDNKVALELAVPLAWVVHLREADFGPSGVSESMERFAKEVGNYLEDAKSVRDEVKKLHDEVVYFTDDWTKRAKALSLGLERVAKLEELAARIRKGGTV